MLRIGLLSDTHNYLPESVFQHFEHCDEIWHAGDFGSARLAEQLSTWKPLRGVYGNIDGADIRSTYPLQLSWDCEGVRVFMTHIGGHPGKYAPGIINTLKKLKPGLFICGHSHILRIRYDDQIKCLHMNPGAAGKQGWHKVKTLIRFSIDGTEIKDCEVIEIGKREGA